MTRLCARALHVDSTETDRMQQMFYISQHDLFDTYLPAYETAFRTGGATGAMCSCACELIHSACRAVSPSAPWVLASCALALTRVSCVLVDAGVNGVPMCVWPCPRQVIVQVLICAIVCD